MIININNLEVIDKGDLCFHDLLLSSIVFEPNKNELTIQISNYKEVKFLLTFCNVFDLHISSSDYVNSDYREIFGWEKINNEDYVIEEIKRKSISREVNWINKLFTIRILMIDETEIKMTCEQIIVNSY